MLTTGTPKQKDLPEPVPVDMTVLLFLHIDRMASLWCLYRVTGDADESVASTVKQEGVSGCRSPSSTSLSNESPKENLRLI